MLILALFSWKTTQKTKETGDDLMAGEKGEHYHAGLVRVWKTLTEMS